VKEVDADNPYKQCHQMIMLCIQQLVIGGDYEKLDSIIQYHVHNTWLDIAYGECWYGIFSAACPVEALHALENGFILTNYCEGVS
jgi:hypothetical protein